MRPTGEKIDAYLDALPPRRRPEADSLIALMGELSGEEPVVWASRIIGFGAQHYRLDSGREGDMPLLAFNPGKARITIYFNEGFDRYGEELARLGRHSTGVSCLYLTRLENTDQTVLRRMLERSLAVATEPPTAKPETVDEYLDQVPAAARARLDELRGIVRESLTTSDEVLSYGILGYRTESGKVAVYASGWKDHVALYPLPASEELRSECAPYVRGKGTMWLALDAPLPRDLIVRVVGALEGDAAARARPRP